MMENEEKSPELARRRNHKENEANNNETVKENSDREGEEGGQDAEEKVGDKIIFS